jgi:adenine-specific DNA-methyltransferase
MHICNTAIISATRIIYHCYYFNKTFSLKNLIHQHLSGKVKLIYIDPPYNTGNDSFNYNDNFNHATWLTFMKNRLEVARDLLSEDGEDYCL